MQTGPRPSCLSGRCLVPLPHLRLRLRVPYPPGFGSSTPSRRLTAVPGTPRSLPPGHLFLRHLLDPLQKPHRQTQDKPKSTRLTANSLLHKSLSPHPRSQHSSQKPVPALPPPAARSGQERRRWGQRPLVCDPGSTTPRRCNFVYCVGPGRSRCSGNNSSPDPATHQALVTLASYMGSESCPSPPPLQALPQARPLRST